MITDEDRAKLGELLMRVFDEIEKEFGQDAELSCAAFLYEFKVPDSESKDSFVWHGRLTQVPGTSPNHIGGLCQSAANYYLSAEEDEE